MVEIDEKHNLNKVTLRDVVQVCLLLGLYHRNTFHIIFVLDFNSSASKCAHSSFDAYCFQLGTVKVIGAAC